MAENKKDNWEQKTIEKIASNSLIEQRRARRWGIFFKLITLLYIGIIIYGFNSISPTGIPSKQKITALVKLDGVIGSNLEVNADDVINGLKEAYNHQGTEAVILSINSPGGSPVQSGIINDEIKVSEFKSTLKNNIKNVVKAEKEKAEAEKAADKAAKDLALAKKELEDLKSKLNKEAYEKALEALEDARKILFATRPTAVNLGWGLEKIMNVAKTGETTEEIRELVISTAKKMADEDIEINKAMGKNGSVLFDDNDTIMTHCNAGALATVAYGTALGVIRATRESGKNVKVIATETRPIQQGSRLTAFELKHDGFDVS